MDVGDRLNREGSKQDNGKKASVIVIGSTCTYLVFPFFILVVDVVIVIVADAMVTRD